MNTLVVAKYNENVTWTERCGGWEVVIYDKGAGQLPNYPGREAHTYLHHICENYNVITHDTIFAQGNPFDHCPDFLNLIQNPSVWYYGWCEDCDRQGLPRIGGLPLDEYCSLVGMTPPAQYKFVCGAMFRVTAAQIHAHPRDFYVELLFASKLHNAGYTFERLWPTIFNLPL